MAHISIPKKKRCKLLFNNTFLAPPPDLKAATKRPTANATIIAKVMDKIDKWLGNVTDTFEFDNDSSTIVANIPTRGLFGFQMEI